MSSALREVRDPAGRTVFEMRADYSYLVGIGTVCALGEWIFMGFSMLGLAVALITFAVFAVPGFVLTGRHVVRVTIDPAGRTLAAGTGGRAQVLPFAELRRAQLASRALVRTSPAAEPGEVHRIDLVLRTGEVLPLTKGYGNVSKDDCLKVIGRINAALGVR